MSTTTTPWIKSSRSGNNGGDCVELRRHAEAVQVRDSKNPNRLVLTFTRAEFDAFLAGAKGEFAPRA